MARQMGRILEAPRLELDPLVRCLPAAPATRKAMSVFQVQGGTL
ncbi:hypothetical protein P775_00980 [Puniceibacterium antarcticum]|uniref:Uncharacterized protein n=1 Tax=Puniceibacterium antarcticum TaxID=1206336 RepID=A0A2G8RKI4_9RHOB|nr:hypothetical protein P775_00980 [Puniceibacterium antarcticum]